MTFFKISIKLNFFGRQTVDKQEKIWYIKMKCFGYKVIIQSSYGKIK